MGRGDHCTELTRQELFAQVWAEPMTKLAQRYGLSDRGLAKICTRTDGDGINDGQELGFDGDGSFFNNLTDTDPLNSDTDGDGVSDGDEIAAGTDPLDNSSYPITANGDVNGDGQVNIADLLLAMRILNGQYIPTQQEQDRWDVAPLVNGLPQPDQQNNLGDYTVLQRKVLGIINF